MLTKEQILAATDLRLVKVEVPEWGGHVFVKNMDGKTRGRYESAARRATKSGELSGLREMIVAITVCDENGVALFDDKKDVEALSHKCAAVMDRIVQAALKANGLTEDEYEDLKNV